ncbi:MAG TPA: HIT family protein [Micromonosporaceae bacterium]|jgi:histidine triad (HIT) family protein
MPTAQCIFCKIVAGEIPSTKIDEDAATYTFLDINPATPGHLLVIPKRHSAMVLETDPEDLTAVVLTAQRMARLVTERLGAEGVNILNSCGSAAWQTVPHLHFHVIPRYTDDRDGMRLPWTPSPADPAELSAVAERLR